MSNKPHQITGIFVIIGLLSSILPPLGARAQFIDGTKTGDTFNPNFLISDEEMQDYASMNREDIEAFLEDYKSFLLTLKSEDVNGEYRMASDIIYRASQEYKINPKYLLVKLQKEQSLITTPNPTQKQLDGATGYGITDGCGWTCTSYLNNKGFGKQVDSAAGVIRWYYDHYQTEPWIKRANQTNIIDGQVVIPANYATAFLYTYTPHIQGNQNFWTLWHKWFGQVYPDGTLAQNFNSSTIYLIQDGKKRAIKSMGVLTSRFNQKMIIKIPESELNAIPDGSDLSYPNYSILKNDSNYYLVDDDTIRPFGSAEVVRQIGYNPDEIISVTADDIAGYRLGSTIQSPTPDLTGRLIRLKENNDLYYLKENIYYSISDPQIAKINFPNLKEQKIFTSEIQSYTRGEPLTFKNGTIFGVTGSSKIFVVENGKKRHIASEAVYNGFGYDWKNIIWTDELTALNHETAQPLYLPARLTNMSTENTISEASKSVNTTTQNIPVQSGKMIIVPDDITVYVGKEIKTPVNTYLIADYKTQEILAGKNIDNVRPLASLTKIMTAYRLMVEGLNLTKGTVFDASKHKAVYHNFRVVNGEKILNRELLMSLLVSSINTPARILVSSVEKDENKFIKRMNDQAKTWGLKNTKFTDTYGYDLDNVTTAREYFTLYTKAEQNKEIRETLGLKSYDYNEIIDKDGKPRHFDNNSNYLMNESGLSFNIISSKTGYLDEAGACLIMLIERKSDKKQFIVLTMGNPDYDNRFDEPRRLAEMTIENF